MVAEGEINLKSGPFSRFDTVGIVIDGDSVLVYDEELEIEGWLRVYRSEEDGCIMFWGSSNVEGNWEFSFEQIR